MAVKDAFVGVMLPLGNESVVDVLYGSEYLSASFSMAFLFK